MINDIPHINLHSTSFFCNQTLTITELNALSEYFDKMEQLQLISISDGEYDDNSSMLLFDNISKASKLNKLIIIDGFFTVHYLSHMIRNHTHIQYCNLRSCDFTDDDLDELCRGISHNNSLEELYLTDNNISNAGFLTLCKTLCYKNNVRIVYLDNNMIDDSCLNNIATHLQHVNQLSILNLSHNKLSIDGLWSLAYMLSYRLTIEGEYIHKTLLTSYHSHYDESHLAVEVIIYNQDELYISK